MADQPVAWWSVWVLEPSLVIGLVLLTGAYILGVGPVRRRFRLGRPARRRQIATFLLGILVLVVALLSPLHALGESYLFSAHMVQHLLITLVAPPLLLLGTPGWLLRPLLRWPFVLAAARRLTSPLAACLLFNGILTFWHLPRWYDLTLADDRIHTLEHLTFLGSAVLLWWPLFSPLAALPRLPYAGQLLYLFVVSIPMKILGAVITLADHVLYAAYGVAPRLWPIAALTDQKIGGVIMWVPGGLIFFFGFTVLFFQWLGGDEPSSPRLVPGPGAWQRHGHTKPEVLPVPPRE